MSQQEIKKILVVEDNRGDARLFREMFNEQGAHSTDVTHVECMGDAEIYLAQNSVDIVLLDLGLPDAHGLEAVRRARAIAPSAALVVLTGLDDESLATQTLKEGAQDYLLKGQIDSRGLLRALRYAVERKVLEDAVSHSARHDVLTGLPNRAFLNDRITQAIAAARRHGRRIAVLFLDLDGFKHINDSLGHPIGDKLLQSISTRLLSCLRSTDTVSRQGGDEFVVLLSEVAHAEDAAIVARKLLRSVAEPHSIDHHDLHITTSMGLSVFPEDGEDTDTLIKNADTAMYQAKDNGRHSHQFFKPVMNIRAVERQSLEEGLRRALEREEFALHYQPKVNLRTGAITGAEALIRWTHPTRGLVSPMQFIPVAEDCGLILPIGKWVLREACKQAQAWVDAGLPRSTMAVNVSAIQLRDESFLEDTFETLRETGLDPALLELELTESVLMKHADATESILKALRAKGVKLAVDDFGTGYSSLSYLRKFSIDCIKIDQSFIRQITTAPEETNLVAAVINMGRSLKLRVVAEGVETGEELAFLKTHLCDEVQGYYFSRPVPSLRFAELLDSGISRARILGVSPDCGLLEAPMGSILATVVLP
jgi:diguanylate cyclase